MLTILAFPISQEVMFRNIQRKAADLIFSCYGNFNNKTYV